jgi:LuxR family maltose regulon positive regulatory protein
MAGDPPTSPLLSVKRTVPLPRPGAVPRERLEALLESNTRLTVVTAPAGWGKTTLLSSWAASVADALSWVSLDETDDEPVRFWSYVLTALAEAGGDVSRAALDELPHSGSPMEHALPVLLNELAASTQAHVLVLDDYHVVTRPEIHENLEFLIAHLPASLRLVIGTRVDPPLPLARMRARGELAEIRVDDLRFTAEESAAMVSEVAEMPLDPEVERAVWRRTEGWAAGVQLTGLALRRGGSASVVMSDDRHLFDYFEQEVLPALDPAQRDLLLRAAPLELLSGDLCDAALDLNGSADVLTQLERAELFVTSLDPTREWFRCHHLLRDMMLRSPDNRASSADVLTRAGHWFADHGRIDDAVRHLLSGGALNEAAKILTSQLLWFFDRGWAETYLILAERLPDEEISVRLAVNIAYAADLSGHADRAAHWLDVCDRLLDNGHDDDGIQRWSSARAGVLALRGVMATPPAESALAVSRCERALALEAAAGNPDSPEARAALGRVYGLDARFDEGADLLAESWRRRHEFGWATERNLQVAAFLGLFLLAAGRLDEVDTLLDEAGPLADAAERDWGPSAAQTVTTPIRLVQGRRAYQSGDLALARQCLEAALGLAGLGARPTRTVLASVLLADVELAQSGRSAARARLVQARDIADNEQITPFVRRWLEEAEGRIGRDAARAAVAKGPLHEELTDRELSILRMLPGTASQREIGAALFLSINTVKAYNKSLYRKLDVGSRADAVTVARELGII